jgi:hypothetical protein
VTVRRAQLKRLNEEQIREDSTMVAIETFWRGMVASGEVSGTLPGLESQTEASARSEAENPQEPPATSGAKASPDKEAKGG